MSAKLSFHVFALLQSCDTTELQISPAFLRKTLVPFHKADASVHLR